MARKQFGVNMLQAVPNCKADERYRRKAFERGKALAEREKPYRQYLLRKKDNYE